MAGPMGYTVGIGGLEVFLAVYATLYPAEICFLSPGLNASRLDENFSDDCLTIILRFAD